MGGNVIPIDGINKLLVNIGHKDDCLSRQEQDELLDEAVGHHDTRDVPVEKILELGTTAVHVPNSVPWPGERRDELKKLRAAVTG